MKAIARISTALVLGTAVFAFAQAPAVNIGNNHGNLRRAQQSIVSAYQSISSAQSDNDGQLGGHAVLDAGEQLPLIDQVDVATQR